MSTQVECPRQSFCTQSIMTDAATGQELAKCLKEIVEDCQLELKKMKSCVTDGAGAMIGRHNGMAAIIKREVPDLINIHCVCHRLPLACADASKELNYIKKVEGLLLQVWKLYEYSFPQENSKVCCCAVRATQSSAKRSALPSKEAHEEGEESSFKLLAFL